MIIILIFFVFVDVEGSEFKILKTIPFQDVDIKVLDIEIDRAGTIFPGTYEDISKYVFRYAGLWFSFTNY